MKRIIPTITCLYIIFCSLYSLSTRFVPTEKLCEGLPADILYKTVILGAGILALCYLIYFAGTMKPSASLFLLAGFLVTLGISTILNREYEFTGNVFGMVTFISQLFVFYFLVPQISKEQLTWCMKLTALVTSLFWTPGCIISLYQYIRNIHYVTMNTENHLIRQGITDGRLFGLFSDPNFAAFTSLLLILLLIFAIRNTSSKWLNGYHITCIVINLMYLIMSNSRTIYIAAVGTLLFFVLLKTYRNYVENMQKLSEFFLALVKNAAITLVAVVAAYSVIFFPMKGLGQLAAPERNVHDMVREDVTTDNITNNRSTIWKNYLELYKEKPVFGFSIRSALPYATEKHPDSYLATTQYVTHNGYLSLLIETGLLGFLIMGAFFVLAFIQSLHRVRQKARISDHYKLFCSLTVAVLIFLMCFHDVFFTVNIETMLLYISIGWIRKENETLPE